MSETAEMRSRWEEYKLEGTEAQRKELILNYYHLVKFVAARMAAGLPQSVDEEDLVSYGMFGLIDAIDKFDPARGFKFGTYAISRIKGAVIDELRAIDWVPRSVRAKARTFERSFSRLENELRRTPSAEELAEELELSEGELILLLSQVSHTAVVALDEPIGSDWDQTVTIGDTIADRAHDPDEAFEVNEMKHLLADPINCMPDRERLVLTLYYYEGLTLAEIGGILNVTESRVCQIHSKILESFQRTFEDRSFMRK